MTVSTEKRLIEFEPDELLLLASVIGWLATEAWDDKRQATARKILHKIQLGAEA